MSAKIKTGIVGFGYMGEIRLRNVMEHPDMEIVGICDPNRETEISAKGVTYIKNGKTLLLMWKQ
jgi:glyceraldehyde-3-phosphate dehydrogenase/erythrose-4-phosphate dehydrogenase